METFVSQDLSHVLNSLSSAYVIYDLELNLLKASDAATRLFGWQKEDVVGKSLHDVEKRYLNVPFFEALECTAKDGIKREVIDNSGLTKGITSSSIARVGDVLLVETSDLTSIYEMSWREKMKAQQYEDLLNKMDEATLIVDCIEQTLTPNKVCIELFGDVVKFESNFFSTLFDLPVIATNHYLKTQVADNEPYLEFLEKFKEVWLNGEMRVELVKRTINERTSLRVRKMWRWEYEGKPRGIFMTSGELKSENNHRNEFEETRVQQFAQGIAHDFGNVAQAFDGYVKLLRNEVPSERGSEMLDSLEASAHRALRIARKVSEVARFKVIKNEPFDVLALLERERESFEELLSGDVELKIQADMNLDGRVYANPDQIELILENLVENANRALAGSGSIEITCHADGSDDYLEITVADNGPAIPKPIAERIFEPFISSRKEDNTGLGLYLAHEYLQTCGGDIELHNHNRDVSFTVRLARPQQDLAS